MGHIERPIILLLEVPEKEGDRSNMQRGNSQRVPKLKKDTNSAFKRQTKMHMCLRARTAHARTHTDTHKSHYNQSIYGLQKNSELSRNATWETKHWLFRV